MKQTTATSRSFRQYGQSNLHYVRRHDQPDRCAGPDAHGEPERPILAGARRGSSKTDALSTTTRYTYNQLGQKLSETDALGNITCYTYDLRGRLTQTTYPNGTTSRSTYDPAGNQIGHEASRSRQG